MLTPHVPVKPTVRATRQRPVRATRQGRPVDPLLVEAPLVEAPLHDARARR